MSFGLQPEGFVPKTLLDVKASIENRLKTAFGVDLNLDNSSSVAVRNNGTLYPEFSVLWSEAQKVIDSFDLDQAEGASLDALGAITGNSRKTETFSTASVNVTGSEGTIVPQQWVRTVVNTGDRFVANNVGVNYTIPPGGTISVPFVAETGGPVSALANTIINGASFPGIDSTTNPSDASVGSSVESDALYRQRIKDDLQTKGNATLGAIREALLELPTVVAAKIFENAEPYEDDQGRPANSFQSFIQSNPPTGDESAIQDVLFGVKSAGIEPYGTELPPTLPDDKNYTDPSDGQTYKINFERTSEVPIYVLVDITSTDASFPVDGADQIKALIDAYGLTLDIDQDVIFDYVKASYISTVPGIVAHELYIKSGSAPTGIPGEQVNITISELEIANFDTANMIVNVP